MRVIWSSRPKNPGTWSNAVGIAEMRAAGMTVAQIADAWDYSRERVYRLLPYGAWLLSRQASGLLDASGS